MADSKYETNPEKYLQPIEEPGSLYALIRDVLLPSVVFILMVIWLWREVVRPMLYDPAMRPTRQDNGGGSGNTFTNSYKKPALRLEKEAEATVSS